MEEESAVKRIPSPAENCVFNNIIVTCSGIALMSSNILYKQERIKLYPLLV